MLNIYLGILLRTFLLDSENAQKTREQETQTENMFKFAMLLKIFHSSDRREIVWVN